MIVFHCLLLQILHLIHLGEKDAANLRKKAAIITIVPNRYVKPIGTEKGL